MENIDFQNLYSDFLKLIENRLIDYIPKMQPEVLYEPFSYFMSAGGKRIRPVITMTSAGAVGGNPVDALNSSIAIEILHNFTLVHDDIMDKSPMRRNNPTVHTKWDEPTAILTGDVMIGYAYNLLPNKSDNSNSEYIIKEFNKGLIEVCEGQAYDMQFNSNKNIKSSDYILMITKKTARLLEAAAVIGGYIGNSSAAQINSLRNFANALGLAFQIQDDLLDLMADQKELGKTIGQDIQEGKKTYLIIKAIEKAKSEEDIALLDKFMNENGLTSERVNQMRDMFERLKVLDDTEKEIDKYFNLADSELQYLPKNIYTGMLGWIINKLRNRKY